MSTRTAPTISAAALARAAATGAAGAAFSVDRNPRLARGLGLAMSAGVGVWTGLAASGVVGAPGEDSSGEEVGNASPAMAAALGLGLFAVTAGVSEVGLRGQRRLERWAARTNGHPRLTIGVLSAVMSLAIDAVESAASRD